MRELLSQTTWEKITIQALCEHAGVSRTTFYSHFNNKDDLLDSLLSQFEEAMLSENNFRSLSESRSFKFLPILTSHVSGNRELFARTNKSIEGYPVAYRFRAMVQRLVAAEFENYETLNGDKNTLVSFIAGAIYNSIVEWCDTSDDATHLKLLQEIDANVRKLL